MQWFPIAMFGVIAWWFSKDTLTFTPLDSNCPNSVETAITWTNADFESPDMFWEQGNPTKIVFPMNGFYTCILNGQWATNATGYRQARVIGGYGTLNALQTYQVPAAASINTFFSMSFSVVITQYTLENIEIRVLQTSGAALNLSGLTLSIVRNGY